MKITKGQWMARGHWLISGTLLVLAAKSMAAQTPIAPRRCEAPRVPVGAMRGAGDVAYSLKSDGRPDTASIMVLAVRGLSVPAFRNAAVRVLERCRFDQRNLPSPPPAYLTQTVFFDSAGAHLTYAGIGSRESIRPLELLPPEVIPHLVDEFNVLLEERPLRIECASDGRASSYALPPSGIFPSRGAPVQQESRESYWMTLTVGADGKVVKGSAVATGSTDPGGTNAMIRHVEGCRFVPGRIAGIPVAVSMRYEMKVRTVVEVTRTVRRVP